MKVITLAIIGCGRISGSHFPGLQKNDQVRIKYACDLIESKAQKAKDTYPKIENVITDYTVALQDSEVDAVYVLTPNYAHYTITMDALKAGKHVFCEKPITVNYALSKEMADEANKRGLMLNIGVCNRYHESVERLAKLNSEGEFGNIYHVVCSFRQCRSIPGLGGPFTDKSQSGGGVLIDWGVHFLDLIMYILGGAQVKTVTCDTYNGTAKDMKDYTYKSMWAEDTANVENGVCDVEDFVCGHVRTDKASITFNGAWAQNLDKAEMYIDFLGDKAGARLKYCDLFEMFYGDTLQTENPKYEIPNMYEKEGKGFIESIITGKKSKAHIDNVIVAALLMDMMYTSADLKKEVVCDK